MLIKQLPVDIRVTGNPGTRRRLGASVASRWHPLCGRRYANNKTAVRKAHR